MPNAAPEPRGDWRRNKQEAPTASAPGPHCPRLPGRSAGLTWPRTQSETERSPSSLLRPAVARRGGPLPACGRFPLLELLLQF